MNVVTKETLLKFYFGMLEEQQRLNIEKEMLTDPEILLDYLDLKRELEAAAPVPQQPSPFLWKRLAPAQKKKLWIFTVATGLAAAAAAFAYISLYMPKAEQALDVNAQILIDSTGEHSFASGVL